MHGAIDETAYLLSGKNGEHLLQAIADLEAGKFVEAEPVRWHALRVQSGKERQACGWLRDKQFKPYWARYRVEPTRIQERRHVRWRSVIPGYLFLPIPFTRSVDSEYFEYAPGIYGFMRNASRVVVRLSEAEIDQIRNIEDALQASTIAASEGIPFKVGRKVRIVRPGLLGEIKEITNKRRIIVESEFLGAPRRWTLAESEIEAI